MNLEKNRSGGKNIFMRISRMKTVNYVLTFRLIKQFPYNLMEKILSKKESKNSNANKNRNG